MGHALLGAVRGAQCPHVGLGSPGLSPSSSRSCGAGASPGLPVFSQLTPSSEQGRQLWCGLWAVLLRHGPATPLWVSPILEEDEKNPESCALHSVGAEWH